MGDPGASFSKYPRGGLTSSLDLTSLSYGDTPSMKEKFAPSGMGGGGVGVGMGIGSLGEAGAEEEIPSM